MQSTELMSAPGQGGALMPRQYAPQQGGGLSAGQVAAIGLAYWRQGAMIAAAVVLLAALATMVMPKTYTATATLMVNYEINDPLSGREFPAGLLSSYMSTQLDLLGSADSIVKVVERLKLTENEKYAAGFDGDPRALPEYVAKNISKKLEIKQGQYGSQLIFVTFSASDPHDASAVANEVVQVYFERAHERATVPAEDHAKRYGAEIEELRNRVATTQAALDEFRHKNNIVDIQAKADIDIAMLNELEHRLLDAQNARRGSEAKLTSDVSTSSNVLGSTMVQSLKTQLSTLESHLAQLRSTLGPKHPEVLQVQSQIASTRQSLNAEVGRYRSGTSGELNSSRELETKLAAAVEAKRKEVLEVRRLQDAGSEVPAGVRHCAGRLQAGPGRLRQGEDRLERPVQQRQLREPGHAPAQAVQAQAPHQPADRRDARRDAWDCHSVLP